MAVVVRLDFILFFYILLQNSCSVKGRMKQYSVCEDKDAKLNFNTDDTVLDEDPLVANWFKLAQNLVNRSCILKKHEIARPCPAYEGRASLGLKDNQLMIARMDKAETGVYLQELHYVTEEDKKHESYLHVTVVVPPSGLPSINATRSSDGKLILTCFEPMYKGFPPVETQFQDSNGKPQNGLVVTVADSMYKCCLLGDAVKCMNQYLDACSIYNVKDKEKDTCISCWILFYVSSVIPWFSLLVNPLYHLYKRNCKPKPSRQKAARESILFTIMDVGTSNETAGGNFNQFFRRCCKRNYEHISKTIVMLIASLAIMILQSVFFCRETDDCISESLRVTICGFGTSFVIVGLLVIIEKMSEISNLLRRGTLGAEQIGSTTSSGKPVSEAEDTVMTSAHSKEKIVVEMEPKPKSEDRTFADDQDEIEDEMAKSIPKTENKAHGKDKIADEMEPKPKSEDRTFADDQDEIEVEMAKSIPNMHTRKQEVFDETNESHSLLDKPPICLR